MKRLNEYRCLQLLWILLLGLLSQNILGEEKYFFEKLSVSDGLSNSVVLCTYQDHLGYLWIGTLDGLNRYDGYDIKVFKNIPGDSTSLPRNDIYAIAEDNDGNLWFGTSDQVSRYNRELGNFTNYLIDKGPALFYSTINNILNDTKGRLWISTLFDGVQIFDKSDNKFNGINYRDYSGNQISYSSEEFVWKIIELKNGNILIASPKHGIFIYNESQNEFQPYFANSKLNLKNILEIFEDSSGKLWLGGENQIFIYDPYKYELRSLNLSTLFLNKNSFYVNFYEDNNKQILLSCEFGILETDLTGNKFSLITENIPNIRPTNFYRDNFGIYWISTEGNGLIKFDPAKKPFRFFKIENNSQIQAATSQVIGIVQSPLREDELLLTLDKEGIFSFERDSKNFSQIQNKYGNNLIANDNGNLWYSRDTNLIRIKLKSGKIDSFAFKNTDYSRRFNINNLKYGPDNNIWICDNEGVQFFNPENQVFNRIPSMTNKPVNPKLLSKVKEITSTEKPHSSILKVGEGLTLSEEFQIDKPSKILIVNLGEGRQISEIQNMFDYGWLEDSTGTILWSAAELTKTFYAGGGFKNRISFGCKELPKGKYKLRFVSDIGHNYGAFNVTAPPDSQWYGIQVHLVDEQDYLELEEIINRELDNTNFPPFETVNEIAFSRKYINTVWIAPNGNGLVKLNLRDNTYKVYSFDDGTKRISPENQLIHVFEDKDAILWITTLAGLIKFDPVTENFQLITQKDGLASNQVAFMIEDQNNNLWFGTPGGISMLQKNKSGSQLNFINFDNTDGINDLPLNQSITMTDDGEIYYGGFGGLNAFYPGSANSTLPKPVITSLNISGIPVEKLATKLNLKTNISETEQLDLAFSDNNLSFEFASIHYSRPAKNKLAYMLEGMDKNWNYTNRRFASYLNLSPGDYVFRLKGSNGDGVWNPEEASIKIKIKPPWYRTIFAYIGYGLLFIGLIFSIDRLQRRRLLNKARNAAAIKEAELRAQLAESENERKTKELEEARQLQLSMLPKELPKLPNLDIAVYMKTATEVGGDYYDFHVSMDGTLTVVIGDATGHGMKAGTMVTTTKSLFNSYAPNPDILFSFQEITRCIKQMNFEKLSMCMTMLKIQGNEIKMSSAGMPPSFIYRRDTQSTEEHLLKGMPLGSMNKFPYEIKDNKLEPGDTILLITDGLPELKNDTDEMYGYKRVRNTFEEVAEKSPEEIITHLKDEGSAWVNDQDPDDDVTFVVIKVK